ncbi:MAG: hypothetical protein HY663_02195 [Chloroflexi bacterium]|nr:hypothetical protein [Chloroflexota bacterium]
MADELNQTESLPQTPPGDRNPPEMEEPAKLVTPDEELTKDNARLIELEQAVTSRESEIASLKQAKDELEAKLTTIGNALTEAVASYKATVVQANPEVIGELIIGDTIEAIDESLKKAKTLVSRVRQGVEAEISSARVPAGAPERIAPDLSALSPREKIQYAIGNKR